MKKRTLVPYMIITTILYGNRGEVRWFGTDTVVLQSHKFCKSLSIDPRYLSKYLGQLEEHGIISNVIKWRRGQVKFQVSTPPRYVEN
jgi:hypothetical protein